MQFCVLGDPLNMEDDIFSSLLSSLHLIILPSFHVTTLLSSPNYYQHLFLTYLITLIHFSIHQLTFFICFITSIYFSLQQIYTFHIPYFFHSTISYFTHGPPLIFFFFHIYAWHPCPSNPWAMREQCEVISTIQVHIMCKWQLQVELVMFFF